MAASFMLVIDCADPNRLSRFWVAALGYVIEPPRRPGHLGRILAWHRSA